MGRKNGDMTHFDLAGAVGIEPTNGGFKGPCLTAWLRPKTHGKI